jgi:hypothetical protein
MSSTNPSATTADTTDNCTDHTSALLPKHVYLGRDTEGYRHHLDRGAGRVTRFDDAGAIERTTLLDDAEALDDYLAFVADEIGWHVRHQIATWDVWGRR